MESEQKNNHILHPKHEIHRTLAHSYIFYFTFFLLGVLLDAIFKIKILEASVVLPAGFVLLVLGTTIILWAQFTYVNVNEKEITKEHFSKGPYYYVRNPTHWGLFFLTFGFGFIVNGFFIILSTILSHFLTKFTFIRKYESIMFRHFGALYEEYKKSVKI